LNKAEKSVKPESPSEKQVKFEQDIVSEPKDNSDKDETAG
jgi:hypothetical protein